MAETSVSTASKALIGALFLAVLAIPGQARATPVTIDFEGLPDSTIVTT